MKAISSSDVMVDEVDAFPVFKFVKERKEMLLSEAQEARIETHTAKGLSMSGFVITGFVISAGNPLAYPAAIVLAICWLYIMGREKLLTSEFRPIPFCNRGLGDLAALTGGHELDPQDEFETDVLAFLESSEKIELRMLDKHFSEVVYMLNVVWRTFPATLNNELRMDSIKDLYWKLIDDYRQYGDASFKGVGNEQKPMRNVTPQDSSDSGVKRIKQVVAQLNPVTDKVPTSREVTKAEVMQAMSDIPSIPAQQPYSYNAISDDEAEEISFDSEPTEEENIDDLLPEGSSVYINSHFLPKVGADRFNWVELKNADKHPVIAVIGPMGTGKSRLVKYLSRHCLFDDLSRVDGRVLDVFGDPNEWEGFRIVPEYSLMIKQMRADMKEMNHRKGLYQQGQRDFSPVIRILEEAKDTVPMLKASDKQSLEDWQRMFGSITRKLKGRVFYVSTEINADSLGMNASGRNAATCIFPGASGCALAMMDTQMLKLGGRDNKQLRENLADALSSLKNPCLIFNSGRWYFAEIPEIDASGNPFGHPDYYDPEAHPEIKAPESRQAETPQAVAGSKVPSQPKAITETVSAVVEKAEPQPTVITQKKQPEISPEALAVYLWARNESGSLYVTPRDAQQKKIKGAAKEVNGELVFPKSDELKALFTELVDGRMARWTNKERYEMEVI